jgi:SAM-dependent methyltransferase
MSRLYEDDAGLYDVAFSWDAEEELEWVLGRMGDDVGSVLELGCGSGRFFPLLLGRGVEPFGVDLSDAMVTRARERLGDPDSPGVVVADMRDFDLGRRVDGAFCAVNTIGYLLTDADVDAHLECVAHHLHPGNRYLVQLDVYGEDDVADVGSGQTWDAEENETAVRFTWEMRELDMPSARAVYRSRIEVLSGSRAGERIEEDHAMRAWTWNAWQERIRRSPFTQTGTFDGDSDGYPALDEDRLQEGVHLVWHELSLTR